jgi:hypothetical protein
VTRNWFCWYIACALNESAVSPRLESKRQVGAEAHRIGERERTRCSDARAFEIVLAEIETDRRGDALALGLRAQPDAVVDAEAAIVVEICAEPEVDPGADRGIDAEELVVAGDVQAVGAVGLDVQSGRDLVALVRVEVVGNATHLAHDGTRA